MADDPKLVETVARAMCAADGPNFDELPKTWNRNADFMLAQDDWLLFAIAALAAINGSGTHWVAPNELETAMANAVGNLPDRRFSDLDEIWSAQRTAYLAKTAE